MSSVYLSPERRELAARVLFYDPRYNPDTTPDTIRRLAGEMFESPPPEPSMEDKQAVREFVEMVFSPVSRMAPWAEFPEGALAG